MKTKSKTKESIIGKIIYGFLLFMPLLAILSTCAYAIFNKNAYQSYNDNYISATYEATNSSEIINGREFNLIKTGTINKIQTARLGFTSISLDLQALTGQSYNYNAFNILGDGRVQFVVRDWNNNTNSNLISILYNEIPDNFTFVSDGNIVQSNQVLTITNSPFNFTYNIYTQQKIDNVFYYSIDKVQESPLFNWAYNTSLYTVLNGTCTTLGINTTFIPMLLSYWLLISLMYLLYDIALLVVHMAHNKIHEIEGSL